MADSLHYTAERNVQIVIALLKANNVRRVIASPGTTNMTFVVSVENDPWFQVWSSVDERSAAYMACGMAAETGEPVVISCTGATASRNYMPGMTEAFYRKLPVLALTSTRGNHRLGHLIDQQVDRRRIPNDVATLSVTLPTVKDADDEQFCQIEANRAMLALRSGPVHVNLYTAYSQDFGFRQIPPVRAICRHTGVDGNLPPLPPGRVGIFVGSHANFSERLTAAVDRFCATRDAVVFCGHTSGYRGDYEVRSQLLASQEMWRSELCAVDLCVHIGEVSGDTPRMRSAHTWRVSPDGEVRDTFGNLRRVFMMPEERFFEFYAGEGEARTAYRDAIRAQVAQVEARIPELPFSNIWIARRVHGLLPQGSELHLGINHSLRSWDYFTLPAGVLGKCNVGGYGIDGGVSAMVGASLAAPGKLFFGVFGDLAFFYDMNVVGNRHVGPNVRIMLVNNGRGTEFRNHRHPCSFLGDEADRYVAAAGHFGDKSARLVRSYAESLGYEYMSAGGKEEFEAVASRFLAGGQSERPMLLEVFTDSRDESEALRLVRNAVCDPAALLKSRVRGLARGVLGDAGVSAAKRLLR